MLQPENICTVIQPPGIYASSQTKCQPNEEKKNNVTVSRCISRHTDQHMLLYIMVVEI